MAMGYSGTPKYQEIIDRVKSRISSPGALPVGMRNLFNDTPAQEAPQNINSYATGGHVGPGGMNMTQAAGVKGSPQTQGMDPVAMQQQAQQTMQQNPQMVQQLQQALMQAMQSGELTMEELNTAVQLAQVALNNPQMYPRLRQFAIQQGIATEQDIPQQYDQGLLIALYVAGQAMQTGNQAPAAGQTGQSMPAMKSGGQVPGSKNKDGSVPITAHEDEFVIKRGTVMAMGLDKLRKMNEKYDDDGNEVEKPATGA